MGCRLGLACVAAGALVACTTFGTSSDGTSDASATPPGDAGADATVASFCATQTDATRVFCADFDTPAQAASPFGFTMVAATAEVVDGGKTGNAVRVTAKDTQTEQPYLTWHVPGASPAASSEYRIDLEMNFSAATAFGVFAGFWINQASGPPRVHGIAGTSGSNPEVSLQSWDTKNAVVGPAFLDAFGQWHHVRIVLKVSPTGYSRSVTVDNTMLGTASETVADLGVSVEVRIGDFFGGGIAPSSILFDEIVVHAQ